MSINIPKELSRENVEKWLTEFTKKLKRTTTRTELDRLILSIDRKKFDNADLAGWTEAYF